MIEKEYIINADPSRVFEALTKESIIEKWSGSAATMSNKEGETFSLWEGGIHGVNIKISPTAIIQDWKEKSWKDFSRVTFEISNEGDATKLKLIHQSVPASSLQSIDNGWDQYYMGPLKAYLESN